MSIAEDDRDGDRQASLRALASVLDEPVALAEKLGSAENDAEAIALLRNSYHLTPEQATTVLDAPLRLFIAERRRKLLADAEISDATWGPALVTTARVNSDGSITAEVDGRQYRRSGKNVQEGMFELGMLLAELVARPRAQPVVLVVQSTAGETRLQILPDLSVRLMSPS